LSRAQWAALEREEWGVTFAAHQCWDVIGLPEQRRIAAGCIASTHVQA
jgi:hypothetical protein